MSASFGSSRSSNQSQQAIDPVQAPFLERLYGRAETDSQREREFFPDSTVVPQDEATLSFYDQALQRAGTGSGAVSAAEGVNRRELSGEFLDPASNPYLEDTFNTAADAVTERYNRTVIPGIESRFAGAGQSRSGQLGGARRIANEGLGDSLSDLATNIYGGNFQRERDRMGQAQDRSFDFAADDFRDIDVFGTIGASREEFGDRTLDDLIARFEFDQDEEQIRLQELANLLGQPTVLGSSRGSSSSFNIGLGVA